MREEVLLQFDLERMHPGIAAIELQVVLDRARRPARRVASVLARQGGMAGPQPLQQRRVDQVGEAEQVHGGGWPNEN